MTSNSPITWTNPREVDLSRPFIYFIIISTGSKEYRYVGKGSALSRMNAYAKNVERVLKGQPKRPAITRDGRPQAEGNVKFRFVHLVLATAVLRGWKVEHYPLENCEKHEHTAIENLRTRELQCDMNDEDSWFIEDFERLSQSLI